MSELHNHDCLSFGDALFLHLERAGMPLNVASVNVFEGAIPFDKCAAYIESKLPELPRYRQRVMTPPFGIGLPMWEFDPEFDIANHVREVKLRRGSEAELRAAVGKLLSTHLDRQRPLWDFTVFSGLKGNRTAVVARLHHCLADGISGVGLLRVMMSDSPEVPAIPKPRRFRVPPPPDPATRLVDGAVSACFTAVERVLTVHSEMLDFVQHLSAQANGELGGPLKPGFGLSGEQNGNGHGIRWDHLGDLIPELAGPTERMPFNVVCRGPQKFCWTEVPLLEIKRIKHACGTTVNDVVLALVTSAIRRYAEAHHQRRRLLRVVVPVSIRGRGQAAELGNRITFVPVTVPLSARCDCKLLAAVHERTALLKTAHLAELVALAGTLLGTIPTALQALLGPIASQLPLAVCNTICTNVPGPQSPLYLLGHKMLACYPYVPIGGEMGMNCAILTYNGTAYFGFTGDVHAIPDLYLLPRFLGAAYKDLRRAAGVARKEHRTAKRSAPADVKSFPTEEHKRPEEKNPEDKALAFAAGQ